MLTLLIWLCVYAGALAILWWIYTNLKLPEPIRIIAVIVIGIVAIYFLFQLAEMAISLVGNGHTLTFDRTR